MTTKTAESNSQALAKLIEISKSTRLSPEQETEAVGLTKASLLAGKAALSMAVDSMVGLPWIIGVTAVVETWPELKATARRNLLNDLSAAHTEQGRRFRLSLGRGVLSQDAPLALKLIAAVCAEMCTTESGLPSQKDSRIFSNVLIGKGKPWLLRLPLGEMKKPEALAVVRCAIAASFSGEYPPLTQLSVMRWIASAGWLAELPESLLEPVAKAVGRWHRKLQSQLKADIPGIPAIIENVLNSAPAPQAGDSRPRKEAAPTQIENRRQLSSRPPVPPEKPSKSNFDLPATLRQIEAHVHSLRSELNQANARLARQQEPPRKLGRDRGRNHPEPQGSDPTEIESLQRHNLQLEETIAELRKQLQDLVTDHEDIAESMGAHTNGPPAGEKDQFKALLETKLSAQRVEFEKLAKEPPDEVFCEHYRLLLEDVFNVLEKQGIVFQGRPE